jgi:Zn-dependent protease
LDALSPENVILGMGWFVVFVFSTCLHEAAHAWSALRLGDPTAYHGGQVTLNPLPHMQREPFGLIAVPIGSFFLYGWMIGWASAPYDPRWAFSYPKRAALMALAGPLSNLSLVIVSGILLRVGLEYGLFLPSDTYSLFDVVIGSSEGLPSALAKILSIFFMLNLLLFVFNLIPAPPLDGSAVVPLVLPDNISRKYLEFIYQPGMWFIGMVVAWGLLSKIFVPVAIVALAVLYVGL